MRHPERNNPGLGFHPLKIRILYTEGCQSFLPGADDVYLIAVGENLKHAAHAKQVIRWGNQKAWSLLGRA